MSLQDIVSEIEDQDLREAFIAALQITDLEESGFTFGSLVEELVLLNEVLGRETYKLLLKNKKFSSLAGVASSFAIPKMLYVRYGEIADYEMAKLAFSRLPKGCRDEEGLVILEAVRAHWNGDVARMRTLFASLELATYADYESWMRDLQSKSPWSSPPSKKVWKRRLSERQTVLKQMAEFKAPKVSTFIIFSQICLIAEAGGLETALLELGKLSDADPSKQLERQQQMAASLAKGMINRGECDRARAAAREILDPHHRAETLLYLFKYRMGTNSIY